MCLINTQVRQVHCMYTYVCARGQSCARSVTCNLSRDNILATPRGVFARN